MDNKIVRESKISRFSHVQRLQTLDSKNKET